MKLKELARVLAYRWVMSGCPTKKRDFQSILVDTGLDVLRGQLEKGTKPTNSPEGNNNGLDG